MARGQQHCWAVLKESNLTSKKQVKQQETERKCSVYVDYLYVSKESVGSLSLSNSMKTRCITTEFESAKHPELQRERDFA